MSGPRTLAEALERWEPVIGLEVHAQLDTASKLFSRAPLGFDPEHPNRNVSAYCLALPGTLPVPSEAPIRLAVRLGVALGMTVHPVSRWARKHYFYPDLPKGYQLTQADEPIATGGVLTVDLDPPRTIAIHRMHLEEDAGKSTHAEDAPITRVDLNRAGAPLVELVTEPVLRTAAEAGAFLRGLHALVTALGVSRGTLEEGSMRADVNVSLRAHGAQAFGTRVEIKNLSSFRFVEQAIEHEILRQARLLTEGGQVVRETRLYDSERKLTRTMRRKEEAEDYRYVPDPDLPPLRVPEAWIQAERDGLPELPAARLARWRGRGVPVEASRTIADAPELARLLDAALTHVPEAHHAMTAAVALLVAGELAHLRAEAPESLAASRLEPAELAELVALRQAGKLSSSQQKKLLLTLVEVGGSAQALVAAEGAQLSDDAALRPIVAEVLAAHPDEVAKLRAGKTQIAAFLMGRIMKRTAGKANPERARALLDTLVASGG